MAGLGCAAAGGGTAIFDGVLALGVAGVVEAIKTPLAMAVAPGAAVFAMVQSASSSLMQSVKSASVKGWCAAAGRGAIGAAGVLDVPDLLDVLDVLCGAVAGEGWRGV